MAFQADVGMLLLAAVTLLFTGSEKVKMLNRREFQVQLDLPNGAAREEALALGQQVARRPLAEPGDAPVALCRAGDLHHAGATWPGRRAAAACDRGAGDRPGEARVEVGALVG